MANIAHATNSHDRSQKALASFEATKAALVADLLIAQRNQEAEGFCFRSSDRDKFKKTLAESRPYEALKVAWKELGLLDVIEGFRGSDDFDGEIY